MSNEWHLPEDHTIRIFIIAGGPSEEHKPSIMDARAVIDAVRASKTQKFECSVAIVTKEGLWLSESDSQKALNEGSAHQGGEVTICGPPLKDRCDIVFPFIDSWNGFGGLSQCLAELADVPFIGCGVLSSALCFDKPTSRAVLTSIGIPHVRYLTFSREDYIENPDSIMRQVRTLNPPWFVKPAAAGSSAGVTKVRQEESLNEAIEYTMQYHWRFIVEEGVPNVRELEVGILGNRNPIVSQVGEITYEGEFFTYEAKYSEKSHIHIPAEISATLTADIRDMALRAYTVLDCSGFARVDFFLNPETWRLYLNEVETSPAITPHSKYPKLMEAEGYDMSKVVETLVNLGFERYRDIKTAGRSKKANL